ncbi:MAG: hypothetical protein ACKOW3_01255 [Hyphomicrobium sp.]
MAKFARPLVSVFSLILVTSIGVLTVQAKECFKKGAIGEAGSEKDAKFQVDEALLQAVDWGAWASWMANGTTPGYSFGPRTYRCSKGGSWGYTCRGQATICKL